MGKVIFVILVATLLASCGTRQPPGENLWLGIKNIPVPIDRPQ